MIPMNIIEVSVNKLQITKKDLYIYYIYYKKFS